ncbi:conserved exported hypothetical protein [Verrucomicrobia bacterium]|nr:conserved exported hypothetical protein [Verrucomicrobiota bacterium]
MSVNTKFKNHFRSPINELLSIFAGVLLLAVTAASTTGQNCVVLHNFAGPDGSRPWAPLVLSGTTLYGTTLAGGPPTIYNQSGSGTLFKVNLDGSGFTQLHAFGFIDGENPIGGLVLSGSTLYGATEAGGDYDWGTVFKVNTDGSGFAVLLSFMDNGEYPRGGLALSGATLYGTTLSGGVYGYGTVFKINTNGTGLTVLKSFVGATDGAAPSGGLVMPGSSLYGTTQKGGPASMGTLFKINLDGSGFTTLYQFVSGMSEYPGGDLISSGTTLYGTTEWLSSSQLFCSTVFSINADGSAFTVLKTFTDEADGILGGASMCLSGSTLYGAASWGGNCGQGSLFRVNTDGTGYAVLNSFAGGSGGGQPMGGVLISGTTLYGTTAVGGISNNGVVFALGYPPTLQTPPQTQTAETGSTVEFGIRVTGDQSLLGCLWFYNGNAIAGCTNPVLCLPSIQVTNIGAYTVVVTNLFGATTSAPALLNVIAPVARRSVPAINLMGQSRTWLNVDYADTLSPMPAWSTLGSLSLSSTSQFWFDLSLPLPPQRFYRAWQTGSPGVLPSLNPPSMVPAITLTGNIADQLRLDAINQFGPTNAWVALATITLTNTSQLYFDLSALGQPPRLYRVVPVP